MNNMVTVVSLLDQVATPQHTIISQLYEIKGLCYLPLLQRSNSCIGKVCCRKKNVVLPFVFLYA
jgi:hypothetical protein